MEFINSVDNTKRSGHTLDLGLSVFNKASWISRIGSSLIISFSHPPFNFSVVCVLETKETRREHISGLERVYVDHIDHRQWAVDVLVQSGMVCPPKLPQ